MDLRDASHEQAVEAIRKAGNPVVFLVQSIINRPRVSENKGQGRRIQQRSTWNLTHPGPSCF